MRELKFRVWFEYAKVMLPVTSLGRTLIEVWDDKCIATPTPRGLLVRSKCIIMQYTGKDSIYDGDIVEYKGEHLPVVWDDKTYSFRIKKIRQYGGWMVLGGKKLKVIGNIYENPELISESKA